MGKYLNESGLSYLIGLIKGFFVKKTGDTMTGSLRLSETSIDPSSPPSSDFYGSRLKITDSTNEQIAYFGGYQLTGGTRGLNFGTTRNINGTGYQNAFIMGISPSGASSIWLSSAGAWRSALGLGSLATKSSADLGSDVSGTLPIANGGTNATNAADARTNLDIPGLSVGNAFLNNNQTIRQTNVKTTSATNNITGNVNRYWSIKDADDNYMTWIGTEAKPDGSIRTTLGARNYGTGAQVDNALYLDIANDGTRSIGFGGGTATRTAWRSALGIHAYGSLTGLSSNTTLTASAAKLPLSTFSGVGCSASSNGIKVEEAGTYMVWGSAYLYNNFTANDIVHLRLYKNSTYLSLESIYRTPLATPYTMVNMGPFIVTLAANDVLYLYAYNQTAARGVVQNSASCGLTIRRIA